MVAVDTNILVYAYGSQAEQHQAAVAALRKLAESGSAWGLPVFVIAEFLRVATHLRIMEPPSSPSEAVAFIDSLLASPSLRILSPGDRYWEILRELALDGRATGNNAHDAAIAAACLEHGVSEILSEDRGFDRIASIRRRPLND